MKVTKLIVSIILLITASFSYAQEQENDSKIEKEAYYNKRAKEDARFEQEFNSKSKSEDKKFWKEQKAYEKELSKRDEIAHKAYMEGKRDAYAEHENHCDDHCNHGHYYRYHVSYYYHNNHSYKARSYRRSPQTRITVRTPSIRLGIF
jgi:uncharacterized protein YxeA